MNWDWWQNLTDAQAQIISSILTGGGVIIGAWMGLGLIGDQVKNAKKEIAEEARKQIDQMREQLQFVGTTAAAGLALAKKAEEDAETNAEDREAEDREAAGPPMDGNRVQPDGDAPPIDYREETKALVMRARDWVRAIADRETDGRYKRTYESIPPMSFDVLAAALHDRGRITKQQADKAGSIVRHWVMYQRGRAAKLIVPQESRDIIRDAYEQMIGG